MPLPLALAWVDHRADALEPEMVDIAAASGRVAAKPCVALADWPDADAAAMDGYAVRAADTEGGGSYDPVLLALTDAAALPPGSAVLVAAGTRLPAGADAILPFDAAQRNGADLEVLAAVARGMGVCRRGGALRAGIEAIPAMRRLRPQDVALLATIGVRQLEVTRRPLVRLIVAGPKAGGPDALTPSLCALIARDGGRVEVRPPADAGRAGLAEAMARPASGIDLLLVAGRCGVGLDDEAPLAFADAGGKLDAHGIAMRPGGSAGLGRIGDALAALLPGTPLACLTAYDMLAGRAVRRMAGRAGALPYRAVDAVLVRKIVSAIGFTDLVGVRVADGGATPLGSAGAGGLVGAARADGFVIVPEGSEGHAPGGAVRVHLYDDPSGEAGA